MSNIPVFPSPGLRPQRVEPRGPIRLSALLPKRRRWSTIILAVAIVVQAVCLAPVIWWGVLVPMFCL